MTTVAHALALIVLIAGCGGSAPTPPETAKLPEAPPKAAEPAERPMRVQGQLGSVDPKAFDAAFSAVLADLQRCHTERLPRIRWLSGDVKFFLRLGEDGAVRDGFLEDSTLGDRETETCMMQILASTRWPAPLGGEGEVRKSLGFDAPANVRAPVAWTSDEITPSLVAHNAKIRACRGRVTGTFKATAYVVPAPAEKPVAPRTKAGASRKTGKREPPPKRGKREAAKPRGRIFAVGIAPPGHEGVEAIDCLVEALKEMPVPSPGSYAAKVTFAL